MSRAELHAAFAWDCDSCGRENFVRAVTVEMSQEDIEGMIAEHGGDPEDWRTGHWESRPDEVTCQHCGTEYEVFEPHQL